MYNIFIYTLYSSLTLSFSSSFLSQKYISEFLKLFSSSLSCKNLLNHLIGILGISLLLHVVVSHIHINSDLVVLVVLICIPISTVALR